MKKGKKVWAGWIVKSEDNRQKFQELVLCPGGSRGWVGQEGGLEVLQERLEGAAAVTATTTSTRNKHKFKIPDEISKMATEAARCWEEGTQENTKKKVRRKFGARRSTAGEDRSKARGQAAV